MSLVYWSRSRLYAQEPHRMGIVGILLDLYVVTRIKLKPSVFAFPSCFLQPYVAV